MSLDTFKSWLTELQNKLRPNALCFHPRLAQNAKLSVLLLIIQQLQSLPTFLLSEKLNELSLSLFMREKYREKEHNSTVRDTEKDLSSQCMPLNAHNN